MGGQTVLIDGERIAEVGGRDEVTIPPTADVTDLGGMTLLPGLIDCHDHIAGSVYGLVGRWELDAPPSLRHLRTAEVLRKTLDTGYTAMRDAGGLDKGFQTAIEEGPYTRATDGAELEHHVADGRDWGLGESVGAQAA